jgi:hypothetical protein
VRPWVILVAWIAVLGAALFLILLARAGPITVGVIEGAVSWVALVSRLGRCVRAGPLHGAARGFLRVGARAHCGLEWVVVELGIGDAAQGGLLGGQAFMGEGFAVETVPQPCARPCMAGPAAVERGSSAPVCGLVDDLSLTGARGQWALKTSRSAYL